jgi:hypothetical protein
MTSKNRRRNYDNIWNFEAIVAVAAAVAVVAEAQSKKTSSS